MKPISRASAQAIVGAAMWVSVPSGAWAQAGMPLGPEFRVNTYTTSAQSYPDLDSDSSGNFVVVWTSTQQDGSGFGVFGQRYATSGTPLGSEFRINTYTTGAQHVPAVARDAAGNFVVVWTSNAQDGSGYGIFGQRWASSGAPLGLEFRANTFTTGDQSVGSVASDASGNFVVVWHSQDGSSLGIFGQRYANSGAPLGSEFRVNTFTTGGQGTPAIAADAVGNFVVIWASYDGASYGVFGQRYASSGAPLGTEFRVNTYTTGNQAIERRPIAADSSGNFVIVWRSTQGGGISGYDIFGQRYASSGAPLGTEFRVNTYTTNAQYLPAVDADAAGNFVVVWRSFLQDGSNSGVFGQRYDSAGGPAGAEFRVNTYTTNTQEFPAVASDAAGNFVVAWQSFTQDGSSDGVFAQRYSQIVPVELMQFGVE